MLDLGSARIAVSSPIARFHEHLDIVYPHQQTEDPTTFVDVRVSVLPGAPWRIWGRQAHFWSEASQPFEPYPLQNALPLFEWGGNWLLAQRLNAYLLLHAGVVARDDGAIILPAAPGSGKSTLTCALHLAGWRFLSDEFGVVDPASGLVLPLLKPAALKNRSIEVIGTLPGATLGPVFPNTRKGDVAHFVPDRDSFTHRARGAKPRLVIFPRFREGATLTCTRLPSADSAMRLGLNSFNYQTLGPVGFHAVTSLARQTHAYELEYSILDEAIEHIEKLFAEVP